MRDIIALIDEFIDGQLAEADVAVLEAWISADRQNAEEFLRCIAIHDGIRRQLSSDHRLAVLDMDGDNSSDTDSQIDALALIAETLEVSQDTGGADPPARPVRWLDRMSKRPVPPAIAVAALFVVAVVTWAGLSFLPGVATNDKPVAGKAVFVAQLVDTHEPAWLDDTRPPSNASRLRAGTRLAIASGLLEIRYNTGAKIVIEGPAEFVVGESGKPKAESRETTHHSPLTTHQHNSGYLAHGRLTARCETKKSHGFTIETPTARVEDLGTEFALAVNKSGRSDVHVFAGSVRLDAQKDGVRTASLVLGTNQTARVDADTEGVVALDDTEQEKRFKRYQNPSQRASDAYAERVLAMRPVAYWRMEGANGLEVANAASDAHQGLARVRNAAYIPWTLGKFGGALNLRGSGDCVVIEQYPASTTGKLTVAAWVRAESRPSFAMIAANWGHHRKFGQFQFSLRSNDGDLSTQIAQADGKAIFVREGADHKFPLHRWQHVAFVADGEHIRLYRNGTEVASVAYDGTLLTSSLPCMAIGSKLYDDGTTPYGLHWRGSIDEIVLLHRALSAEEIRELASAQ